MKWEKKFRNKFIDDDYKGKLEKLVIEFYGNGGCSCVGAHFFEEIKSFISSLLEEKDKEVIERIKTQNVPEIKKANKYIRDLELKVKEKDKEIKKAFRAGQQDAINYGICKHGRKDKEFIKILKKDIDNYLDCIASDSINRKKEEARLKDFLMWEEIKIDKALTKLKETK